MGKITISLSDEDEEIFREYAESQSRSLSNQVAYWARKSYIEEARRKNGLIEYDKRVEMLTKGDDEEV